MIPKKIIIHKKSAILELIYSKDVYRLTAEYLRVFSPSAEVQGHSPSQAVLEYGKKLVQFSNLERQGNYAIKFIFSDGHDSGIYSWGYLHELAINYEENWRAYEKQLQSQGKRRESTLIEVKNST